MLIFFVHFIFKCSCHGSRWKVLSSTTTCGKPQTDMSNRWADTCLQYFVCFSLFCLALKKKKKFKLWTNWNIVLLCTIKRSCAVDSESSEGLRCLFKFAFVAKSSPSCLHRGLVQCHGDQGATCRVEQTVVFLLCLVIYTVMTVFATIVCRNASRQQKQKASWNRSTFLTSK